MHPKDVNTLPYALLPHLSYPKKSPTIDLVWKKWNYFHAINFVFSSKLDDVEQVSLNFKRKKGSTNMPLIF